MLVYEFNSVGGLIPFANCPNLLADDRLNAFLVVLLL